jgi:hypothetical protein
MKKEHSAHIAASSLAIALLLAHAAPAAAQGGRPGRGGRSSSPAINRDQTGQRPPSIQARSAVMLALERELGRTPPPERVRLALAQIGEDYERMQVVNNRMLGAVIPAPAPDYKLVAEATGEIRRRAERLRANLALPKPEGVEGKRKAYEPAADAARLKEALLSLDRSIMSFVKSKVFQNTGVMDAQHAIKASRDLEDVIEMSRLVGRDAERLNKKP